MSVGNRVLPFWETMDVYCPNAIMLHSKDLATSTPACTSSRGTAYCLASIQRFIQRDVTGKRIGNS